MHKVLGGPGGVGLDNVVVAFGADLPEGLAEFVGFICEGGNLCTTLVEVEGGFTELLF